MKRSCCLAGKGSRGRGIAALQKKATGSEMNPAHLSKFLFVQNGQRDGSWRELPAGLSANFADWTKTDHVSDALLRVS